MKIKKLGLIITLILAVSCSRKRFVSKSDSPAGSIITTIDGVSYIFNSRNVVTIMYMIDATNSTWYDRNISGRSNEKDNCYFSISVDR